MAGFGLGNGEGVLGRLAAWPVCSPELRIKQQGTASSDGLHRARRHHSLFFFFFPRFFCNIAADGRRREVEATARAAYRAPDLWKTFGRDGTPSSRHMRSGHEGENMFAISAKYFQLK